MIALVLAGAALRVLFLGARSLWYDEASTLLLASEPLTRLPAALIRDEGNPPLYAALMHCWVPLFSDPRLGLRLFSVLCGIASLFAFRALAVRVLPPRTRMLALALAALSSYWVHLAQDGRVYALLLLVCLAEAVLVWDLSERPSPRLWAAYAGLSAVGLYVHYYFAVALAGHAVWLAARARREPRGWRDWTLAHAVVAVLFLPWLPFFRAQLRLHVGDSVLGEALTPRHLFDTLGTLFYDPTFLGLALPAWIPVVVGVGAAVLLAAAARRARRAAAGSTERRGLLFVLTGIAAPLAVVFVVEKVLGRPVTQARYFAPLSPFAYLAAAAALEGARPAARAARVAALLVVAAGLAGYYFSAVEVDPRLDRLAAALSRADARLPVVYLGAYYYLPMRVYYLPERAQYLAAQGPSLGYDYADVPPYDGLMDRARLARLGRCLVVDAGRQLSPHLLVESSGPVLAARVFPKP